MMNSVTAKPAHYDHGFFTHGSGPKKLLILGSCRILPYLNYFHYLNTSNQFTIHVVDVVNFYFDRDNHPADPTHSTAVVELRSGVRKMIESCHWFLHEHTVHFGIYNTDKACPKNIYQFGMKPEVDVMLPNFNNVHVLFADILSADKSLQAEAKAKGISAELQTRVKAMGEGYIAHFIEISRKTDLPEFADLFDSTWKDVRYFWTSNHVTNRFTIDVMRMVNDKFLHLNIPNTFWEKVKREDMYATPHTPLTKYDVDNYGIRWPEQVKPFTL